MVRDEVTGLIWEAKTDDGGIHDKDATYSWQGAQEDFVAQLNNQKFGGRDDWRVPTIKELSMLVDAGVSNPAINTTYFPNAAPDALAIVWSSPASAADDRDGWAVAFSNGSYDKGFSKLSAYHVRAVRGTPLTHRLADNGDGTVTDAGTGLTWQQADETLAMTWEEALAYCENLGLAGHQDWRLPNHNELQSLVDHTGSDPAIDGSLFPAVHSDEAYWSSTTYGGFTGVGWGVRFGSGAYAAVGKTDPYYVRAVRGGQ